MTIRPGKSIKAYAEWLSLGSLSKDDDDDDAQDNA